MKAVQRRKCETESMVNLCTDIFIIKTDRLIQALKKEGQAVGATQT